MGIEDILKDYGDDLSGLSFDAQPKLKSADAPIVRNTPAPDNLMSPEKMLEEKFAPKPQESDIEEEDLIKLERKKRESTVDFINADGFFSSIASSFKRGNVNTDYNQLIADAKMSNDEETLQGLVKSQDEYNSITQSLLDRNDPNAVEKAIYQASETMPYMLKILLASEASTRGAKALAKVGDKFITNEVARQGLSKVGTAGNNFFKNNKLKGAAKKLLEPVIKKAAVRLAASDAVLTPVQAAASATGVGAGAATVAEGLQYLIVGGMFLHDALKVIGSLDKNKETGLIEMKSSPFLISRFGAGAYSVQKEMAGMQVADQIRQGIPTEYISRDAATAVAYLQGGIESLFNPFSLVLDPTSKALNQAAATLFTRGSASQGSKSLALMGIKAATTLGTRTVQEMSEEGAQAVAGQYYTSQTARAYIESNPAVATTSALYANMSRLADYTTKDYVEDFVSNAKAAGPVSLVFATIGLPGYMVNSYRQDALSNEVIADAEAKANEEVKKFTTIRELYAEYNVINERNEGKGIENWSYEDIILYRKVAEKLEATAQQEGNQQVIDEVQSAIRHMDRAELRGDLLAYFESNYLTQDEIDKILIPGQSTKEEITTILKEVIANRKEANRRPVRVDDYFSLIFGENFEFATPAGQEINQDARKQETAAINAIEKAMQTGKFTPRLKKQLVDLVAEKIPEAKELSTQDLIDRVKEIQAQEDTQAASQQATEQETEQAGLDIGIKREEAQKIRENIIFDETTDEKSEITIEQFEENYYKDYAKNNKNKLSLEEAFEIATDRKAPVKTEEARTRDLDTEAFVENAKEFPLNNSEIKRLAKDRAGRTILSQIYGADIVKPYMTPKQAVDAVNQTKVNVEQTQQAERLNVDTQRVQALNQAQELAETGTETEKQLAQEVINDINEGVDTKEVLEKFTANNIEIKEPSAEVQTEQQAPVVRDESPAQREARAKREITRIMPKDTNEVLIVDQENANVIDANINNAIAKRSDRNIDKEPLTQEELNQGTSLLKGGKGTIATIGNQGQVVAGLPREFFNADGKLKSSVAMRWVFMKPGRVYADINDNKSNYGNARQVVALQAYDKQTGAVFNVYAQASVLREDGKNYLGYVTQEETVQSSFLGEVSPEQYTTFDPENMQSELQELLSAADVTTTQEGKTKAITTKNNFEGLSIARLASKLWTTTGRQENFRKFYESIIGEDLQNTDLGGSVTTQTAGRDSNAISLLSQAIYNDLLIEKQGGQTTPLLNLVRNGVSKSQVNTNTKEIKEKQSQITNLKQKLKTYKQDWRKKQTKGKIEQLEQEILDLRIQRESINARVIIKRAINKRAGVILQSADPNRQIEYALSMLREVNQDTRQEISTKLRSILGSNSLNESRENSVKQNVKNRDVESDYIYQIVQNIADSYGFTRRELDSFFSDSATTRYSTSIYKALINISNYLEISTEQNSSDIDLLEVLFKRKEAEVSNENPTLIDRFRELASKKPAYERASNFRVGFSVRQKGNSFTISPNQNADAINVLKTLYTNEQELQQMLKIIDIRNYISKLKSQEELSDLDQNRLTFLESELQKAEQNKPDEAIIFGLEQNIETLKSEARVIALERRALNIVINNMLDKDGPFVTRKDPAFIATEDRGQQDPLVELDSAKMPENVSKAQEAQAFTAANEYATKFINGMVVRDARIEEYNEEKKSLENVINNIDNKKRRGVKLEDSTLLELSNAKDRIKRIKQEIKRVESDKNITPAAITQAEEALRILQNVKSVTAKDIAGGLPITENIKAEVAAINNARQKRISILQNAIIERKKYTEELKPKQTPRENRFFNPEEAAGVARDIRALEVIAKIESSKLNGNPRVKLEEEINELLNNDYSNANLNKIGTPLKDKLIESNKKRTELLSSLTEAQIANSKEIQELNAEIIKLKYQLRFIDGIASITITKSPKQQDGKDVYIVKNGQRAAFQEFLEGEILTPQEFESAVKEESRRFGFTYKINDDGSFALTSPNGKKLQVSQFSDGVIDRESKSNVAGVTEGDLISIASVGANIGTVKHELAEWSYEALLTTAEQQEINRVYGSAHEWANAMQNYQPEKASKRTNIVMNKVANFFRKILGLPVKTLDQHMQDVQQSHYISDAYMSGALHRLNPDTRLTTRKSNPMVPSVEETNMMTRPQLQAAFRAKRNMLESVGISFGEGTNENMTTEKLKEHVARTDYYFAYALAAMNQTATGKKTIKRITNAIASAQLSPEARMEIIAQYDKTGVIKSVIDNLKYSQANLAAPAEQKLLNYMSGVLPAQEAKKEHKIVLGGKSVTINGENVISLLLASRNPHTRKAMMTNKINITVKKGRIRSETISLKPLNETEIKTLEGLVAGQDKIISQWKKYTDDASRMAEPLFNEIAGKEQNYLGVKQGTKWVPEENWFPTIWAGTFAVDNIMGGKKKGEAESWMFAKRGTNPNAVLVVPDISQIVASHASSLGKFVGMGSVYQQLAELINGPRGSGSFYKSAYAEWDSADQSKFDKQISNMISQIYGQTSIGVDESITRNPIFRYIKQGQDIYRLSSPTTMLKMASSAHLVRALLNDPANIRRAFTTAKYSNAFEDAFSQNTYQYSRGQKSVVADVGDTASATKGRTVLGGKDGVFEMLRSIPNIADRSAMKTIYLAAAYDLLPTGMPKNMASVNTMLKDIEFVRTLNEKANMLTMETQPTYESFMRSEFMNRGNLLSVIFGRYGTQRNRMLNMMIKSYVNYQNNDSEQSRKQLEKTLTSVLATNTLVMAGVALGNEAFRDMMNEVFFGGEDDEKRFGFEKRRTTLPKGRFPTARELRELDDTKIKEYARSFGYNAVSSIVGIVEGGDELMNAVTAGYGAVVGKEYLTERAMRQTFLSSEVSAFYGSIASLSKAGTAKRKMNLSTNMNDYMNQKRSYAYNIGKAYSSIEQLIGVGLHLPTRMLATTIQSREIARELAFESAD